jgi:galactokinase
MSASLQSRLQEISQVFQQQFGSAPAYIVRAPGRVNLIGEHTDYNEGFVFPAAINREMLIAATPHDGRDVEIYSDEYKALDKFSLDDLHKSEQHPWVDYLRGTLDVLNKEGHALTGFKAVLSGNVPQGAGLSSSAAYEVAVATFANEALKLGISATNIALLAQKAENQFIGVQCGIMDQFISALGQPDSALFIDCRTLDFKAVPTNFGKQDLAIVITNSGVRRGLVDSEYNARRQECVDGTKLLAKLTGRKLKNLRDISLEEFSKFERELPDVVAKRCRHVISENERVEHAVAALEAGDTARFGKLMNDSHQSLRDDFEVSCMPVDVLVDLTQKHPGVIGARMTGAGFGGCTVALMKQSSVDSFKQIVLTEYEALTGQRAEVYVCEAVAGARVEQAGAAIR